MVVIMVLLRLCDRCIIVVFVIRTTTMVIKCTIDGIIMGRSQRFWSKKKRRRKKETEATKEGNKGKERKNQYTSIPSVLLF